MPRGRAQGEYDQVMEELFRELRRRDRAGGVLDFTKRDLEGAIRSLGLSILNVPDIKYTYDARRPFPAAITESGDWGIIGRGKGLYSFVQLPQPNLIRVPDGLPGRRSAPSRLTDETPPLVRRVLGNDEQATLTRVFYSGVIRDFAGLAEAWRVQGHERTTVSAGQIEVDEVYVGKDRSDSPCVLPISAKGGNDCLSYTQALNLNLYAAEKRNRSDNERRYQGFKIRPLGLCRALDGTIYVVEFSRSDDVREIRIVRHAAYQLV